MQGYCKPGLDDESQFMRLATIFAFSAAAVSALTSGGKEATKRLQVWDWSENGSSLLLKLLRPASSTGAVVMGVPMYMYAYAYTYTYVHMYYGLQRRNFSREHPLRSIVDERRKKSRSPTRRRTTTRDVQLKTYSPSATAARPPASWGRKAPCAPRARTTRSRRRASTVPRPRHILNGPRAHRPCTSPHQTI